MEDYQDYQCNKFAHVLPDLGDVTFAHKAHHHHHHHHHHKFVYLEFVERNSNEMQAYKAKKWNSEGTIKPNTSH